MHEGDGRVDGFATCGPTRDDDVPASAGEVYGLYVHPRAWGRGAGAALLAAAVAALPSSASSTSGDGGAGRPLLWALEGNGRARRFYAHQGWVEDGARRRGERPAVGAVAGITSTEVRYRLAAPPGSSRPLAS